MIEQRLPWLLRPFDASRDADDLQRLETSYTSRDRYQVRADGARFVLEPGAASAPLTKTYLIDLAADDWHEACVAVLDGRIRGFIAWGEEQWNRRMSIWHFYVDLAYRRLGAGRLMMAAALAWAAQRGLVNAWVETSSTNMPGIASYRRLGFEICGFDKTLYAGMSLDSEFAIYMARRVEEPGADGRAQPDDDG